MLNPALKILLLSNSLWYFGEGMLGPIFAVFAEKIGGSILDIAGAWAIYLLVTGIGVIIVGRISDRINKEKLLLGGFIMNTVFTFGYLLVSAPVHLFIVQAGLGLAVALANPPWFALYGGYVSRQTSGFTWGLYDGLAKIFSGIAIVAGGFIVSYFSFEALFITMGTVQLLATANQARILKYRRNSSI